MPSREKGEHLSLHATTVFIVLFSYFVVYSISFSPVTFFLLVLYIYLFLAGGCSMIIGGLRQARCGEQRFTQCVGSVILVV